MLHPISIVAIVILLWNDHWLRIYHPSWLSGKLGDFAWLTFAPFICALLLAWIIPQRLNRHEELVGLSAFAFIGLWFALAKTIPLVHDLTVMAWDGIVGWHGTQHLDPTDLLTLPALLVGGYVWRWSKDRPLQRKHLSWVIIALGVFATLASSDGGDGDGDVDAGIANICSVGQTLVTYLPAPIDGDQSCVSCFSYGEATAIYTSADGGFTWQFSKKIPGTAYTEDYATQQNCSGPSKFVVDPKNSGIQYRWQPAQTIERSIDGGKTWTTDHDLYLLRQDVRPEYKPSDQWVRIDKRPGPRNALVDPATVNVVFTMGWDGVLVRTSAGVWSWATVGNYHLDNLNNFNRVQGILFFEWWQAGALIILILTTSKAYLRQEYPFFQGIGGIGWLVITVLLLPANHPNSSDYLLITGLLGLILLGIGLLLTIGALVDIVRNFRYVLPPILGTGLVTALLYLLPMILWTQGTIPRYTTAMLFSLFLTASAVTGGYFYLRGILPIRGPKNKPKKKKRGEVIPNNEEPAISEPEPKITLE